MGTTSARQGDDLADGRPAPRLRDHFRVNSNNILASALGVDGTSPDAVPLRPLNRLPSSIQMASPRPLEADQMTLATSSPSSSRAVSDSQASSDSALGVAKSKQSSVSASSSVSHSHSTSNSVPTLKKAKFHPTCTGSSRKTSPPHQALDDD